MRIFVFGRDIKDDHVNYVREVITCLEQSNIHIAFHDNYLEKYQKAIDKNAKFPTVSNDQELASYQPDFCITLGGDGTILEALTLISESRTPILGINLGRLGFLASTEKAKIKEAIHMLKNGMYTIQSRSMLYLESNFPLFGEDRFALNDFTLTKRDNASMVTIHTFINGDFLNSYWADGLIVATPTGSTGYSLSCGGPIVFPSSGNFVLTPVAPHNLNVRPIVISDEVVISFEIEGRSENFLCTLDSRFETITSEHQIAIRKCDFDTRLVQLNDMTFLKTIHDKLTWGKDRRN